MMSKKTAIIMILVVFIGALAALVWFYFTANTTRKPPIQQVINTDIYDPFGTVASDSVTTPTSTVTTNDEKTIAPIVNKLRQLSSDPTSGYTIINTKTGETNIHYILRANGNIYEAYSGSLEFKRLSNTTIPKVYESNWLANGQRLIIRYLKDATENIETFSVKINPATTTTNQFEGGVDGTFLPENISSLAVNPAGDRLFYLTSNFNGSSGLVSKPDGLEKKLIFESPLIEWNVSWPKDDTITLTTKPSAQIPGFMYFLNSKNGSFSRVIGNIRGLTTKTNDLATEVLYSDSNRNTPRLYLYNVKKGESKLLPWSTFPEKCVWSTIDNKIIYCAVPKSFEEGNYPDLWYQGLTNFTDDIWQINIGTGASTLISDIKKETGKNLDVIDLQIDKNDNHLFFIDKTSLTLWSLGLK